MKTLSPLRLLAYAVYVLSCIPVTMAQYDYINTGLCFWDVRRTGELHYADPSPEATAMRRYQDYPVSHATGTADISIPLVELPAGDATVSLGLSYHTGAIKRDEESTDVGLGWSLTGLGVISRRINGYPDEWTGDGKTGGFYNSRTISFRLDPYSQDWKYMLGIMEGWYDTDYDLFSYSVPGYSGQFIIQNDTIWHGYGVNTVRRKIRQLPPTDLHIDCVFWEEKEPDSYEFHITTPEDLYYRFDQAEVVSRTTVTTPSMRDTNADPDYEAEAVWHPTYIRDNKKHGDTLRITYRDGGTWTRGGNYTSTSQGYMIYRDQYDDAYRTKYSSYDNIVRIENTVSAYTRMIPARISGASGSISFGGGMKTSVITLRNAVGDVIRTVTLDNDSCHGDGRRRLDGVTIRSDGRIVDSYRFTYNRSGKAPGSDIFGYSNGNGYRYGSVLGLDLKWEGRRPDPANVSSASLKTVTDIAGITTTLEYEPVDYDVGYGSLFGSSVCIGHRLRSIRAECPVTGRYRTRTFIYDRPRCNISLGVFNYTDFLTQSGFYEKTSLDGTFRYSFGVTHTTSPTTRGVSLENAVVYYGKVTEEVSGTGLENPVRTVYEYNTDPMVNTFHQFHRTGSCIRSNAIRKDRFLPLYSQYYSNQMQGFDSRPLDFAYSTGYFQERTGAEPLLTCRTDYERVNGIYCPRMEQRIVYTEADKEELYVGGHCESTVLGKYDEYVDSELGIDCTGDMNCYFIKLYSSRFIRESAETTTYYPDGNSRTVKSGYLNRGGQVPWCPGFEYDTTKVTPSTVSHRPMGISISCGEESLTLMTLSSWMSTDSRLDDAAYDRFTRTMPEVEKLVYRTAEGADSVHRRYGYRYGREFQIYLDRVSLEAGTYTDGDTAVIARRYYTDYDIDYRPVSMIDEQGRRVDMTWMELYDNVTSRTYRDAGLTTSYTYKPLVGCTGITYPSGSARKYGYEAGRLSKIMNTYGETLQEYSYSLYNDRNDDLQHNIIRQKTYSTSRKKPQARSGPMRTSVAIWPDTTSVKDEPETGVWEEDDGYEEECEDCETETSSVRTVHYDGFGMPVQTVGTVAGGSLVRTATEYDALDRPVRQYLPVPATDDSFLTLFHTAASSHYGDNYPYSHVTYRGMPGDRPLQVLKEGEAMQGHPERYEYLCNSVTDQQLRCRRYRLSGSRDSETVTLDGYYPAGALDVTKTTDPDGCLQLTFTDWRGFTILQRKVLNESVFADTYYLYDARGNARVILQPEASACMTHDSGSWSQGDEGLDKFAFINRYDRRGNCIYAKTPGGGAVEMRYDRYNRLAFRQTAVMRERDEAEFTLYDPIGRVALCGISPNGLPEVTQAMTTCFDGNNVTGSIDGTGYVAPVGVDLSGAVVTSVNYYDSYDCLDLTGFSALASDSMPLGSVTVKGQLAATRTAVYEGTENEGYDTSYLYSLYCYDIEGNVIESTESTVIPGTALKTQTEYTVQGSPLNIRYELAVPDSTYVFNHRFYHDSAGFISRETASNGNEITASTSPEMDSWQFPIDYTYDDLGRLSAQSTSNACHIAFGYNMRGQIYSITSPSFSQYLKYENGSYPNYNGNISEMYIKYGSWYSAIQRFKYDKMNRLATMVRVNDAYSFFSYNLNSNIKSVMRRGLFFDGSTEVFDDLLMTYDGNRLTHVDDSADPVLLENFGDFYPDAADYSYDSDGRMTGDTGRGITIVYNPTDRPAVITTDKDSRYLYSYDATGLKLSESRVLDSPLSGIPQEKRLYVGPFELDMHGNNHVSLHRTDLPWGYVTSDCKPMTYVADYQGNIRSVIDSLGTVIQENYYYPYGMSMILSTGAAANPYKYSGKELETRDGLNQYDFGARLYLPTLGQFNRPDPLAIKTPSVSPYAYCAANPVMNVDPTGLDTWRINTKGEVVEWIAAKEFDRFEFIDDDGNILLNSEGEEQVLQFGYGTVLNYRREEYANVVSKRYGNKSGIVDIYEIKGDQAGTDFYEMFAQNVTLKSGNEVGLFRTGNTSNGPNFITSGHQKHTEVGGQILYNGQLKYLYYIRERIHSHKYDSIPSKGDIEAKRTLLHYTPRFNHSTPIFLIRVYIL